MLFIWPLRGLIFKKNPHAGLAAAGAASGAYLHVQLVPAAATAATIIARRVFLMLLLFILLLLRLLQLIAPHFPECVLVDEGTGPRRLVRGVVRVLQ